MPKPAKKPRTKRQLCFSVLCVPKGGKVPKNACTLVADYYEDYTQAMEEFRSDIMPRVKSLRSWKTMFPAPGTDCSKVRCYAFIAYEIEVGPPEWGEYSP